MNPSDRASLRHFLSAALIFGKGLNDSRDPRTRVLEAFDEWFALYDAHAKTRVGRGPGQPTCDFCPDPYREDICGDGVCNAMTRRKK